MTRPATSPWGGRRPVPGATVVAAAAVAPVGAAQPACPSPMAAWDFCWLGAGVDSASRGSPGGGGGARVERATGAVPPRTRPDYWRAVAHGWSGRGGRVVGPVAAKAGDEPRPPPRRRTLGLGGHVGVDDLVAVDVGRADRLQ